MPKIPVIKLANEPVNRFFFERKAAAEGHRAVAGVDEAGRGPLAGPVVASAVVIRDGDFNNRIDDSKKLTARMREKAFEEIAAKCDIGVGLATVEEIDSINIFNATLLAMKRAVGRLRVEPDLILVDGQMNIPVPKKKICLNKGESKSISIACASIIAKVSRDRLMVELDKDFPQYGFAKHKGYGTRYHMEAIIKYGLSPAHRRSFGPFGTKEKELRT